MGVLDFLSSANPVASVAKGAVEGFLSSAGTFAKDVRAAITGQSILDPTRQAELAAAAQQLEGELVKGQLVINLAEAQSDSLFKGGWRPAVGWVGVLALLYMFLLRPLLPWCVSVFGVQGVPALPAIETGDLFYLLTGMLGFGAMRSFDKMKGTS